MKKTIFTFLLIASCAWALSLRSSVRVTIRSAAWNAGAFSVARDVGDIDCFQQFDNGTATDQCSIAYQVQSTVSSASQRTFDLAGSLTDTLGNAVVFAKVKSIYIRNLSTDTLVIGNATNAWSSWISASGTITLPAYGQVLLIAPQNGWSVTAGSADILGISNIGISTASFNISVLGTN